MSHTPEPWRDREEIKRYPGCVLGIESERGATLMHGTYFRPHIERARADYKRARAAVNATAGIPTEALEADVVKRMREALKGCRQYLYIAVMDERNAGRKTTEAIARKDLAALDALLASIDGDSQ